MTFILEIICSSRQTFCLSVKTQFNTPVLLCPPKLNYDIVNLALSPSDSLLERPSLKSFDRSESRTNQAPILIQYAALGKNNKTIIIMQKGLIPRVNDK